MNNLQPKIACKDALPVHKGVYRTFAKGEIDGREYYNYWDGQEFRLTGADPRSALFYKHTCSSGSLHFTHWQGCKEPPVGEWMPAYVKPVHPGVYQVQSILSSNPTLYARWDGRYWMKVSYILEIAERAKYLSFEQTRVWRGLQYDIK